MYVNPFWFGVLMTIVVEIVLLLICIFAQVKLSERYEDESGEDDGKDE